MHIEVTRQVLTALAREAAEACPAECCGILLGEGTRIAAILPAANVHPAPRTHFEIEAQTLINAHRAARGGGPQVLGYYHSHPKGAPEPSVEDAAMAARDGSIWAIIGQGKTAFWHDTAAGFAPLSCCIVGS